MNPEQYKEIRETLDLTQGRLAAALGVTRKTISSRETGVSRISTEAELAIRALLPARKTAKRHTLI
jgi:DNA-binding XRE family transcriptional regulator